MREMARFVVAFAAGAVASDRLVAAGYAWRLWHRWIREDPSGADLYRTNFWIFSCAAALAVAVAGVVFWLLRPASARGPAAHLG